MSDLSCWGNSRRRSFDSMELSKSHSTDNANQQRIRKDKKPERERPTTGLVPLHVPSDEDHDVDIVFVHGIFARSKSSARAESQTKSSTKGSSPKPSVPYVVVRAGSDQKRLYTSESEYSRSGPEQRAWGYGTSANWPKTFLPSLIPGARIFTFGYEPFFRKRKDSNDRLSRHARALLSDLAQQRSRACAREKPLIFVAHSFGGLVCKAALAISRTSPHLDIRNIFDLTATMFFIATPQTANSLRKWGSIAAQSFDRTQNNINLLESLSTDLDVLIKTHEQFRCLLKAREHLARPLKVRVFFETQPFRPVNDFIVSKEAAQLRPFQSSQLPGDHLSLIKFSSETDPGLQTLLKQLREECPGSRDGVVKTPSFNDLRKEAVEPCLRSLEETLINNGRNRTHDAAPGTCDWLLEHPSYLKWTQDEELSKSWGLLWIHGGPGSGKSTLMKYLVNLHETDSAWPAVNLSFFFSRSASEWQSSCQGFYQSLLAQLLRQVDEHMGSFLDDYNRKRNRSNSPIVVWSLSELATHFHGTIAKIQSLGREVRLFVDAVDECRETEVKLLLSHFEDSLSLCATRQPTFRTCWSSRSLNYLSIQSGLEVQVDRNAQSDIERLGAQSLPQELQGLANRIAVNSSGSFLWTTLVVEKLRLEYSQNPDQVAIARLLEQIPHSLNDLYEHMFAKIGQSPNRDFTYALLCCMLCALEPLHVDMLALALSYMGHSKSPDHLVSHILKECAGLIVVGQNEVVQFVHFTAKEFLNQIRFHKNSFFSKLPGENFIEASHACLAESCVHVLEAQAKRPGINPSTRSENSSVSNRTVARTRSRSQVGVVEFAKYALKYVFRHLVEAKDSNLWTRIQVSFEATQQNWVQLVETRPYSDMPLSMILQEARLSLATVHHHYDVNLSPKIQERLNNLPAETLPETHDCKSTLKSLRFDARAQLNAIEKSRATDAKTRRDSIISQADLDSGPSPAPNIHDKEVAFVNLSVSWQVATFVSSNFDDASIGDIVVLNGVADQAQATSVSEYFERRWPLLGDRFVQELEKVMGELLRNRKHEAHDETSANHFIPDTSISERFGISFRRFYWDVPRVKSYAASLSASRKGNVLEDTKSAADRDQQSAERLFVEASGSPEAILDLLEALAWLAAALRPAVHEHEGLAVSNALVEMYREDGDPRLDCLIYPQPLKVLQNEADAKGTCWHRLFDHTIVVAGLTAPRPTAKRAWLSELVKPRVETDNSEGFGLEISLARLVSLSDTKLVQHDGRWMLLGYSIMIIPTKILHTGAVQWHLIASAGGKRISVWEAANLDEEKEFQTNPRPRIKNPKTLLNAPMHYLGLWEKAKIMLGTKEGVEARSRLEDSGTAKKWWRIVIDTFGIAQPLGPGAAIPVPNATVNVKMASRAVKKDQKWTRVMDDFRTEPCILYDPTEKRAWMAPCLSVIYHMVHLFIKKKGYKEAPPFAEPRPDGGQAASEAIGKSPNIVLFRAAGNSGEFSLNDYLEELCLAFRLIEPNATHFGRLRGHDFADLAVCHRYTERRSGSVFDGRIGWHFFSQHVPVIFINGLGELIMSDCQSDCTFEHGRDYLMTTVGCVHSLVETRNKYINDSTGQIFDSYYWHSDNHPYTDPPTGRHASPCEQRKQFIINTREHGNVKKPDQSIIRNKEGGVIFAKYTGEKLQKANGKV